MKYELETIPVWDAFEHETECPLCYLDKKAEDQYLDFFLGNSVMAPEMRVEVNKTGFCRRHFQALYKKTGKLGLALMTQTHLQTLMQELKSIHKRLESAGKGNVFTREGRRVAEAAAGGLQRTLEDCLVCRKLERTVNNYTFTILYLYQTNEDFPQALRASKGFCLHHLKYLVAMGPQVLKAKHYTAWLEDLFTVQTKDLERLEGLLGVFSENFDYHQEKVPMPPEAKESLPLSIDKIVGK